VSVPMLDRTWTEDEAGAHLRTDVEDFAVDTVRYGSVERIRVRGELDIATAPLLRGVLDTVYARRPERVEVDLSGLTFVDVYSMTTLVAARRRLAARGAVLVLRSPSPVVRRLLGLTGFDRTFQVDTGSPPETLTCAARTPVPVAVRRPGGRRPSARARR
jgi:anti-anti-sigma factor